MKLSQYNQELYQKIVAKINSGYKSIFYSEATGLGKSIIMQELIGNVFLGKHILYVTPKYSIWNNLSGYPVMKSIDCKMYAAFKDEKTAVDIFSQYDVVFIDECHHMYSDIQGRSIQSAMRLYPSKYFIGFTATPKIKNRLADEAFSSSCYGLDIYDAVAQGIFPKIRYAVLVPEMNGNVFSEDIITQIKSILSEQQEIVQKCLVYLTCIDELLSYAELLRDTFADYEIVTIHSNQLDSSNKSALEYFNRTKNKVMLLSVDSLLEGVHLDNAKCVISFRHTQSMNVLLQLIGRLCKPYSKIEPLFIDVADSISSVRLDSDISMQNESTYSLTRRTFRDVIEVHCNEYKYVELYERLKRKDTKIKTYKDFTWTSNTQLAKQLGVSPGSISSWLRNNIGATVYDYIDFKLDKKTMYRDVDCSSLQTISECLHKSISYVREVTKLNNYTRKDFVDFVLKTKTLQQYTHDLNIVYYRDVDCYDINSVSKSLQMKPDTVKQNIEFYGDVYKFIDATLLHKTLAEYLSGKSNNKKFSYKGVQYSTKEDLCNALGVTVKAYEIFIQQDSRRTARDFIDLYR